MENIGGQAVIEGVMLRKKNTYTIAVRDPKNKIRVIKRRIKDYRTGLFRFLKYPVFRGMYSMYEMLDIGIRSLTYSSNISIEKKEEKISKREIFWLIVISILLAIGIFVVLPYILTVLIGFKENTKPIQFNIIDAIIKTIFFILYVVAISRMKDIKRLFQYHGAEHKTVYCYENKEKITVRNVKKYSTLHPRCGSSFIILVIVISIILFSFIPLIVYSISPGFLHYNFIIQRIVLLIIRILTIPVIAGISYEVLKLSGKYYSNPFFKLISLPGLGFQKLTTGEPDNKQIEVAIRAIKPLI